MLRKSLSFIGSALAGLALAGLTFFTPISTVITGNAALCAAQAFGTVFPANSFYCFNNTFGIGSLVNGTDFHQSILINNATFPNGTQMQWQFPNSPNGCTGCGAFAYGYPEIFYGKGESGANPFKIDGPWYNHVIDFNGQISGTTLTVNSISANSLTPGQMLYTPFGASFSAAIDGTLIVNQLTGTTGGVGTYTVSISQTLSARTISAVVGKTMNQLSNLTATYNITLGGNLGSYDTLMDSYVTNDFIGTSVIMEFSFFPQTNLLSGIVAVTCHTFSAPLGEARVGIQPSGTQVLVVPTTGGCSAQRQLLNATVDLKEVYSYLITQSAAFVSAQHAFSPSCTVTVCFLGVNGGEYLQGIQLGIETQVPAPWNGNPFNGFKIVNSLSYVWN